MNLGVEGVLGVVPVGVSWIGVDQYDDGESGKEDGGATYAAGAEHTDGSEGLSASYLLLFVASNHPKKTRRKHGGIKLHFKMSFLTNS